jgi:hypothetical protein
MYHVLISDSIKKKSKERAVSISEFILKYMSIFWMVSSVFLN